MPSNKIGSLLGALVFLAIAALALYRLLVGFPISIGGQEIGQTTTFFVLVICLALSLMLFRGGRAAS